MAKKKQPTHQQIGKLPPMYRFFLNPYQDMRWSKCPQCDEKMHQRKFVLFIHIESNLPLNLNKNCRYCPHCDLLIAHQNDMEQVLSHICEKEIGSDEYLVLGTVEKKVWKRGDQQTIMLQEALDAMHDFKEVITFKVTGGWMPRNAKR